MYVINRAGAVEYVNSAMLDISGDSREQFVSQDILDLLPYKESGLSDRIKRVFEGEHFRFDGIEYTSIHSGKTTVRNFIGIPLQQGAEYKASPQTGKKVPVPPFIYLAILGPIALAATGLYWISS